MSSAAPLRVLVVTNMYPSADRPALGGFVRDQVESLRRVDGLDVELFAFEGGGPGAYVRAARALRARYRGRRFDVVHAHYGLTGWPALAAPAARRVVTFHGDDLVFRGVRGSSLALLPLYDLPATVSRHLAARRRGGLPGAGERMPVAVLPCGVDLDRFQPYDRRAARERLGLDPDGRYLLLPADPARREKRADRARELAEAAGATLLTYSGTHPDDVPHHVNAANAVVATSDREGFGLAPLEALACDVPVLATDVGVAPLVLAGIGGTLCAPFELRAWVDAVRPHLDAPDPRVDGRGRAAVYGRERMALRVAAAYRELAARG